VVSFLLHKKLRHPIQSTATETINNNLSPLVENDLSLHDPKSGVLLEHFCLWLIPGLHRLGQIPEGGFLPRDLNQLLPGVELHRGGSTIRTGAEIFCTAATSEQQKAKCDSEQNLFHFSVYLIYIICFICEQTSLSQLLLCLFQHCTSSREQDPVLHF